MSNEKGALRYAEDLAALPIIGVRFLLIRDLPELVKKFIKGTKTLDYGCGPGHTTTYLKSLGLDVHGVDINNDMLDYAKKLDPEGNYYLIESAKVPFSSGYYDFIYMSFVLMYCKTKSEMVTIVEELARVLKPGGALIIGTINENTYKYKWLHEDTDFEENKNPISGSIVRLKYRHHVYATNHYYWTHEDYYEVIEKAGLDLAYVHEPLGKETDGFSWINEKENAIGTLYVATKKLQ